ncbi:MAG: hypothetical protein ABIP51_19435, partial [Bacteroidia bacterium]
MRIFFFIAVFFTLFAGYSQQNNKLINASNSFTWYPFTGSRNIHGVLNSFSKPLHYNPAINAVSFIHNASPTYSPSPSTTLTETGAIVAMISSDFGQTWDST